MRMLWGVFGFFGLKKQPFSRFKDCEASRSALCGDNFLMQVMANDLGQDQQLVMTGHCDLHQRAVAQLWWRGLDMIDYQ